MNYYKALQREKTGVWDYTCTNDGRTHATGYCAGKYDVIRNDTDLPHHENYHADGHATKDEARSCYKKYLLDHQLRFGTSSVQQNKCEICEAWTQGTAVVDTQMFYLCDEHRTREVVEGLFEVYESCSSW